MQTRYDWRGLARIASCSIDLVRGSSGPSDASGTGLASGVQTLKEIRILEVSVGAI